MNQDAFKDLIRLEHGSLREELRGLKNCQVTFVTFAITSTGAVLGLGSGAPGLPRAVVFLAPLLVLLPTWLIFFDKATSINRIVGYMRIIEGAMLSAPMLEAFLGWENALAEYRKRQGELKADATDDWSLRHITKYHEIVFMTYVVLVATCLCLGWTEAGTGGLAAGLWWFLFAAAAVTLSMNTRYIFQLSWGKYSSRAAYLLWRKILVDQNASPIELRLFAARSRGKGRC